MNRPATALSIDQARKLQLAAQGLLVPPKRRARQGDVVATIERMALLQIDTINVVARSPYFVLFSRIGDYDLAWLDRSLEERRIFECWSHEACFAPAADFPFHRANANLRSLHWAAKHALRTYAAHREPMEAMLAGIAANGAMRAADYDATPKGPSLAAKGWWGWKDEKRWLEAWFALGELMVARRDRFQRVYDITARVRPDAANMALPLAAAVRRHFILEAVRALGVVPARHVADYFRMRPRVTDAELAPLVDDGTLIAVEVENLWPLAYVHASHADTLERAASGRLRATHSTLLSPFDPLVWDRARASELFGFEYRLECYTPAPKRVYGYFVLPILDRGRIVGRLDAKAHRAEGRFEVKRLYVEDAAHADERLAASIHRAVATCAAWHRTPDVTYGPAEPRGFRRLLEDAASS